MDQNNNIQVRLLKEKHIPIRKYMDYPKFLSLISTNSLYFARPNEFEDPLDSLFPEYKGIKNDPKAKEAYKKISYNSTKTYIELIMSNLKKTYNNNYSREQAIIIFEMHLLPIVLKDIYFDDPKLFAKFQMSIMTIVDLFLKKNLNMATEKLNELLLEKQYALLPNTQILNRNRALVNCWHIGEYESDLMWKLYAKKDGIMIQSNTKKLLNLDLKKYLEEGSTCVISKVKYINLAKRNKKKDKLQFGCSSQNANSDILCHYFEKSKSLQDEKELRIVIAENIKNIKKFINKQKGELVKINLPLSEFIDKIIISPYAPNYYSETLIDVLNKMNQTEIAKKITYSEIKHEQDEIL